MNDNKNNPFSGLAKFLIALGLVMIAAKTDILGLGVPSNYFTWEMLLIFFGIIALFNLDLVACVFLFAAGYYFLMPEMSIQLSPFYKEIYWPCVLVLAGIMFMIRPLYKRIKHNN